MKESVKYNQDTFSTEEYRHIKVFIDRKKALDDRKDRHPNSLSFVEIRELRAINWVLSLLEEISTE